MSCSVAEAIREGAERLAKTSDTARLDAELLMAHSLGLSRSDMLLRAMQDDAPANFNALVERSMKHEPVAHILGVQEFYGREFAVSPDVLIPRGDSEILIDSALELTPQAQRVLDLGTGSGALLLTALLELEAAKGIAIDASKAALDVAQNNAARLGLTFAQAQFLLRDWCKPDWTQGLGAFDLILCNPPYVEADAALEPNVRDFEPASALFAGSKGLDDYNVLIPQLRGLMKAGGVAIFEIGAKQADSVSELAITHGFTVETRHDLANRPRAVVLR